MSVTKIKNQMNTRIGLRVATRIPCWLLLLVALIHCGVSAAFTSQHYYSSFVIQRRWKCRQTLKRIRNSDCALLLNRKRSPNRQNSICMAPLHDKNLQEHDTLPSATKKTVTLHSEAEQKQQKNHTAVDLSIEGGKNENDNVESRRRRRKIPTMIYTKPEKKKEISNDNSATTTTTATIMPPVLPLAKDINYVLSRPRVEALLVGLVLLSSFSVAYGTLPDLQFWKVQLLRHLEEYITYIFATEFVLRLWANYGKQPLWQYLAKPLVLVDLLVVVLPLVLSQLQGDAATLASSVLPTWLLSRSGLINLRLLRILRVQRILKDLETFSNFEEALGFEKGAVRPYQLQLARVLLSVFTLLSVSTGLIYTTEHVVNPDIPDYFTALYFGLTTLTTVGFGDITPVTTEGKLVVSGSILAGVAIIPAQAARFVEALLDYQKERDDLKKMKDSDKQLDGDSATCIEQPGNIDTTAQADYPQTTATTKLPVDGMLDTRTLCTNCGAAFHWSDATFCWSCGTKLDSREQESIE